MNNKSITITMNELATRFDELMVDDKAMGFTIGRGKKIHWFITPSPSGFYYAYPDEGGDLGWRRVVEINQKVTVHYE